MKIFFTVFFTDCDKKNLVSDQLHSVVYDYLCKTPFELRIN